MRALYTIDPGARFGRLTFIRFEKRPNKRRGARCLCDCGSSTTVEPGNLRRGLSRSCGCLANEMTSARSRTHGATIGKRGRRRASAEYQCWIGIKRRCFNRRDESYHNYGGRGITMSALWVSDFAAFLAHVGQRPSPKHSLDRINNDGDYEPGNVRWATHIEQAANRRPKRSRRIIPVDIYLSLPA